MQGHFQDLENEFVIFQVFSCIKLLPLFTHTHTHTHTHTLLASASTFAIYLAMFTLLAHATTGGGSVLEKR